MTLLQEILSIHESDQNRETYNAFVKMHKKIDSLTRNPKNKENNNKAKAEWSKVVKTANSKSPTGEVADLDVNSISKLLTKGQSIINYYYLE